MENQAPEQQSPDDVRKSGYLRKQKSMHRRYFVLRAASERGPARLEYYESEKKFRAKAPVPKRSVSLETCFNINKRADAKNKYMIVLYTRAESFAIAAESESDQNEWFQAMLDLQCKSKCVGRSPVLLAVFRLKTPRSVVRPCERPVCVMHPLPTISRSDSGVVGAALFKIDSAA